MGGQDECIREILIERTVGERDCAARGSTFARHRLYTRYTRLRDQRYSRCVQIAGIKSSFREQHECNRRIDVRHVDAIGPIMIKLYTPLLFFHNNHGDLTFVSLALGAHKRFHVPVSVYVYSPDLVPIESPYEKTGNNSRIKRNRFYHHESMLYYK